ncbi:hypothetical protein K3495_g3929 [Podosphaera aphanis]|nr:hypothetical protein K3495_g3929 [Podosphaera aphanis]
MSLDVALQSVAFYVLSCSTCAKANHRRKAKAQAKRERAYKIALEAENPSLYQHPSPFSTNQYWNEEIMMGPGQHKKSEKGATCSTKRKVSETTNPASCCTRSSTINSDVPSSPTTVTEESKISDQDWNRKRYQREDEALWGYDHSKPGQLIIDAVAKASSAAGRLLEGGLSIISPKEDITQENPPHYYMRNPPVNDLHPPIVSTSPLSIAETRWMIQPPPTAKVMEGKERVNRSRASSTTSSRRGATATPLGRKMIEKIVDAKIQRGESPSISSHS